MTHTALIEFTADEDYTKAQLEKAIARALGNVAAIVETVNVEVAKGAPSEAFGLQEAK